MHEKRIDQITLPSRGDNNAKQDWKKKKKKKTYRN